MLHDMSTRDAVDPDVSVDLAERLPDWDFEKTPNSQLQVFFRWNRALREHCQGRGHT
eukprot:gene56233-32347_t